MCLCVCVSAGERVRGHRRGPVAARGCGATQFLDSKKGMLGAQQLVTRKGNDSYCVNLLSGFDLSTTQGQRGTTSLHSSSGGPAVAFLAAIPGGCMTLSIGTDMLISSVCHHLWYHVPADVAAPPFKCVAAVAVRADHALVCEKVATIAQMA